MASKHWGWWGLLGVGLLAFWALLAGPSTLLGVDLGKVGTATLVLLAWGALYAISRMPQGEAERGLAPGEWRAWVGVAFMLAATGYFLARADVFAAAALQDNPHASAVGRHLVLLLVAWSLLSGVLGARWKGRVQEDERDREIEKQAAGWGRGALIACIVAPPPT